MKILLLLSVFVIATCGLVYELISSTLASYLLGDSVTQFSTVIGVYLFSMGIGSYLSRFVNRHLTSFFVQVEFLIGLVGGSSGALLFLLFDHVASFRVLLYSLVSLIGILVGFEIPCLMRILKDRIEFKELVSEVFTYDYVGALLASLLFPLVLVPYLGLVRSSFLFGILNVLVAFATLHLLGSGSPWVKFQRVMGFLIVSFLGAGFYFAEDLVTFSETRNYQDHIVYAKSSPYQRVVLTQSEREIRLFLNGNLQFSSRDEYRYHEALVHPALAGISSPKKVLILGGGDGLALREILKYPSVERVLLVDLDPIVTTLFKNREELTQLNQRSLFSEKLQILNQDAFIWIKENKELFDFIVVDFPDPSNYSIGKLFTTTFYRKLYATLSPEGAAVIQSTSPYVAPKAYWCIDATLKGVGFRTAPYHAYVPSFGEWGFNLAHKGLFKIPAQLPTGLRFLDNATVAKLFEFPPDMKRVATDVNQLNNQVLVRYFEEEWGRFTHGPQ